MASRETLGDRLEPEEDPALAALDAALDAALANDAEFNALDEEAFDDDETFGAAVVPDEDFDFTASAIPEHVSQPASQPSQALQPPHEQLHMQQSHLQHLQPPQTQPQIRPVMTAQEVESFLNSQKMSSQINHLQATLHGLHMQASHTHAQIVNNPNPPPQLIHHLQNINIQIHHAQMHLHHLMSTQPPSVHPQQLPMHSNQPPMPMQQQLIQQPIQNIQQNMQNIQISDTEEPVLPPNIQSAVDSLTDDLPSGPSSVAAPSHPPQSFLDLDDFPVLSSQPPTSSQQKPSSDRDSFKNDQANQHRRFNRRDRPFNQNRHRDAFDSNPSESRNEPYAGLMRKFEKELIAKIQISSLITDDPLREDFYYEIYTKIKNDRIHAAEQAALSSTNYDCDDGSAPNRSSVTGELTWQQTSLLRSNDSSQPSDSYGSSRYGHRHGRRRDGNSAMNHIQQQLRRLIENRKQRPREATVSLVGALGKIAVTTTRNPRQMIQVASSNLVASSSVDGKSKSLSVAASAAGTSGTSPAPSSPATANSSRNSVTNASIQAQPDLVPPSALGSSHSSDVSQPANMPFSGEPSNQDQASNASAPPPSVLLVPMTGIALLRGIEDIYTIVIDLEMIKIQQIAEENKKNRKEQRDNQNGDGSGVATGSISNSVEQNDQTGENSHPSTTDAQQQSPSPQALAHLWTALHLGDSVPFNIPHPFVCFMNRPKGLRIFPRAARFLTSDQILHAILTILYRFELLDVASMRLGTSNPLIDTFMMTVFPMIVSVVADAPVGMINMLVRVVLERHNVVWFVGTRVGMSILNVVLSRAEMLKQNSTSGASGSGYRPSEQELGMWSEIYSFLFQSIQGHFASFFPAPSGATVTNSENDTDTVVAQDQHLVWQFMSAMAVGALGIDHQRILVTELREVVIQTSKSGDTRSLDNVNLFLNALGLGISASQLAAMQI